MAIAIKIDQFLSIDEVYSFIEGNIHELDFGHDFTDVWIKFREHTTSDEQKQFAQWEVEFFLFSFIGGRIFSLSSSNGKKPGEIQQYPQLDKFQKAAFDYLKKRAIESTHPLLKSRYNNLLWKGVKGIKNKEYAIKAIEDYEVLLVEYYTQYKISGKKDFSYKLGTTIENVATLCSEIKYESIALKGIIKSILFEDNNVEFFVKESIVREMLKFPKIFKVEDFTDVLLVFEQGINNSMEKDDFLWVTGYLQTAIKVAQRTKSDEKRWHNEEGLAYLRIACNESQEDRFWLKLNDYAKAITAFTLAGNSNKKAETEELYFDLKPKVKLPIVEIPFDDEMVEQRKKMHDDTKTFAIHTLKSSPIDVYKFLAGYHLLPKSQNILEQSKNSDYGFLAGVNTIYFDNNKNISSSTGKGLYNNEIFKLYNFNLQGFVLPFLHYTFILGVKSNHLTSKNFLNYLIKHTWIGKPFKRIDLGGEEQDVNWVEILAPSITEYFAQIQAWTSSNYYLPSFVLCVDSLTLKIEGLLRNFCERLLIPTSTSKRKGMQELHMQDILKHELILKYFDEDDLLFFNYIFGNEGGLNLRNNIAHCFYNHNEYYSDLMLLLMEALLRISKYDYKEKKSL